MQKTARHSRIKRLGMMDLNQMIIAITLSIIMTISVYNIGTDIFDVYNKNADGNKLTVISNALSMDINRNGDISILCSDGSSTWCLVSGTGTYGGCAISNINWWQYRSWDALSNITLSMTGAVTNIKGLQYVICPKSAAGVAFSGTNVNPSFYVSSDNGYESQGMNFNP